MRSPMSPLSSYRREYWDTRPFMTCSLASVYFAAWLGLFFPLLFDLAEVAQEMNAARLAKIEQRRKQVLNLLREE